MTMPYLDRISQSKDTIAVFGGLNRSASAPEGSFVDMKNLSSIKYPHLSPRAVRGYYRKPGSSFDTTAASGLLSGDGLYYTDGEYIIAGGQKVNIGLAITTDMLPKSLVAFGAYVLVFPDRKWFNTVDGTFGDIDAVIENASRITFTPCRSNGDIIQNIASSSDSPENPENGSYWLDTSEEPAVLKEYTAAGGNFVTVQTTYVRMTITGEFAQKHFSAGDAIRISGITADNAKMFNGTQYIVSDKSTHLVSGNWELSYVITGLIGSSVTADGNMTVSRKMPKLDYVIECGNRLWGCRYGKDADNNFVNEIYASKLGDFKNWEVYQGISTDSYRVTVGRDGKFTGAYTFRGYPHFFKEDAIIKIYGTSPSSFQTSVTEGEGVCSGCSKSLAVAGGSLYYKTRSGVAVYDGSLPTTISGALGDLAQRCNHNESIVSIAEGVGDLLYIYFKKDNKGHFLVYDTNTGIWMREDTFAPESMCAHEGELYATNNGKIMIAVAKDYPVENFVDWMAETGDFGAYEDERKYVSRLSLMMRLPVGSKMTVSISYDGGNSWDRVFAAAGKDSFCHDFMVRIRRCERFRLKFEGTGDVEVYSLTKYVETA